MRSADVMGVGARLPVWGGRWDRGSSSSGRGGMPSGGERFEDPEIGFHGVDVELDDGILDLDLLLHIDSAVVEQRHRYRRWAAWRGN